MIKNFPKIQLQLRSWRKFIHKVVFLIETLVYQFLKLFVVIGRNPSWRTRIRLRGVNCKLLLQSSSFLTLHKKRSFPLRISSVNVTKYAGNFGFGHIYWRNLSWKTSCFVQCDVIGVLATPLRLLRTFNSFMAEVSSYRNQPIDLL